ncbi:MAG: TadE/TadG family type IV pilus assembly protein [Microthrixaceae bacterium]
MISSLFGLRSPARERSAGQALVEFALVAPMLFLVVLGIIEAGRFIFHSEILNNAAREGARYAIVHGADATCPSGPAPFGGVNACDPNGDNVKTAVHEATLELAGLGEMIVHEPVWTSRATPANPSPGDSSTGTNARGEYVTVFLDFTYKPMVAYAFDVGVLPEIQISAESTLVINY